MLRCMGRRKGRPRTAAAAVGIQRVVAPVAQAALAALATTRQPALRAALILRARRLLARPSQHKTRKPQVYPETHEAAGCVLSQYVRHAGIRDCFTRKLCMHTGCPLKRCEHSDSSSEARAASGPTPPAARHGRSGGVGALVGGRAGRRPRRRQRLPRRLH